MRQPLPRPALAAATLAAALLGLAACGDRQPAMVAADAPPDLPPGATDAIKAEGAEAFGLPPTSAARKSAPMPSSL